MKRLPLFWFALLAIPCIPPTLVQAGCCDPITEEIKDQQSTLILEARVLSKRCHRLQDGRIVTDFAIRPIEVFKGDLHTPVHIRFPGGQLGNQEQFDCRQLHLVKGRDYLFRLVRHRNTWRCLNARAEAVTAESEKRRAAYRILRAGKGKACRRIEPNHPAGTTTSRTSRTSSTSSTSQDDSFPTPIPLTAQASGTGYFESNGVPGRFVVCDTGEPILCLVDTEVLPAGISQAQAMQAAREALDAWQDASGLIFKIEANVTFGLQADAITTGDGKLRLQLHDQYNAIASTSTLGIGGGGISTSASYPNGGIGGNVAGQEFHKRTHGYCSLNHRASSLNTYSTFVEVLTHEIGHALGLRHSSENATESDSSLSEAMMYFRAHKDGRGASLENYDITSINFGYPASNMPPYTIDRIMYAVSGNPQPTGAGVNVITLEGSDRETPTNASIQIVSGSATSSNGTFSTPSSSSVVFTPSGFYSDSSLSFSQIEAGVFYDRINYRVSDGTHLSPYYSVRVVGMRRDSTPLDGLPDSWMTTHFKTTTVAAPGEDHHPDSDPDNDGLNNRIEFVYGSDPNDASSGAPRLVYDHSAGSARWNTIAYMPYFLEASEDMTSWTTLSIHHGNGSDVSHDLGQFPGTRRFYRIRLQP